MKYKIYFINQDRYSAREGKDLEAAKQIARNAGFQARIENDRGEIIGTYCPLVGYSNWDHGNPTRA
jgi:hypothetical protein